MLIEFIGSPCSGKTNSAARLFEKLKTDGLSCEFLPEQARQYIVETRAKKGIGWGHPLTLTDEDQQQIFLRQFKQEMLYQYTCSPESLIVTDSSPFNTCLYFKDFPPENEQILTAVAKMKPLVFWCRSVASEGMSDQNRIHDMAFSQKLDSQEFPRLVDTMKYRGLTVIELNGNREDRFLRTYWEVIEYMKKG